MTNLSIATVSHALNGTRAVSKESKKKVLKAAREIGYRPNLAARTLKTKKSKTIGLAIPRVERGKATNYFYMDIVAGVHARLNEGHYSLIIGTYQESNRDDALFSLDILEKRWADGLLVVPNSREEKSIRQIVKSGVPFVLIDREVKGASSAYVVSANEKGAYEAVRLMFEGGKRKIAFVGSMLRTSASYDRFLGYKRCVAEFDGAVGKDAVILNEQQSIESGMTSAARLVAAGFDGIFVSDNILTIGVFRYLKQNKVRIPGDVSLIGYDDYDWMNDVEPAITTVRQKPYEMGYRAAGMLLERLENPDSRKRQRLVLDTELVLRNSH